MIISSNCWHFKIYDQDKLSLSLKKGTSWLKSSFSGKFISKDLMSFIGHISIKTTFQPLRLIRIDADIVQHINLSEIRSVSNSNTRSFELPWQPVAQFRSEIANKNCDIYTCTPCIFLKLVSNERLVNALYYFDSIFELAHLHIYEYSLIIHFLFQVFHILLALGLKAMPNTRLQYLNTSYK